MTHNQTIDRDRTDTNTHSTERSFGIRVAAKLSSALLAVAMLAGVAVAVTSSSPAGAATGTTHVTVCTTRNTSLATPLVSSYWWNGSTWTQEQYLRTTGCVLFTPKHSGYYYFQTYSYAIVGCSLYRYYATSAVYIKQNLPANSTLNYTMRYYDTIGIC